MSGRLLDRAEAAERLHISERTVRRLTAAGDLTEVRVSVRSPRIDEDSVERYIAERRVTRITEGSDAA
jgi:excisionase family DNA binding protein